MKWDKVIFWGFILILGGLSSCTHPSGETFYESPLNEKDISLEKVDEFILQNKPDSDFTIGDIRFDFASSADGELHAFFDETNRQFLVADSTGEIQQLIAREGKGPDEILNAAGFDMDEQNQLVVYDNMQRMIKIFDHEGELKSSSELKNNDHFMIGNDLTAFDKKLIAGVFDQKLSQDLNENEAQKSTLAGVFGYDGELVDTIGTYDPAVNDTKHYNFFSMVSYDTKSNRLISTQYSSYRIQLYELETGERLAWFGRDTENFNEGQEPITGDMPLEKVQKMSIGRSTPMRLHFSQDYIMLYFENMTEEFYETENRNDREFYIALYDRDTFESYGEFELPHAVGNVAGNKLYLIEDNNPDGFTVGMYEFTE